MSPVGRAILPLFNRLLGFAPMDRAESVRKASFVLSALWLAGAVSAAAQLGDCVLFREGGAGLLFKAPSYWLRGSIAAISSEQRLAGLCPQIGKPESAYTREDWVRVAAATPCVDSSAEVREVTVTRISVAVDAWETPWSSMHGTVGWLFRGHFLDQPLKKGELIDMDASWLVRCPG